MNTRHIITALSILISPLVAAQNVSKAPEPDSLLDAIQVFSADDHRNPEQPSISPAPNSESSANADPAPHVSEASETAPVSDSPVSAIEATEAQGSSPTEAVSSTSEERAGPENGLSVRVEKMHSGNGTLDPALIQLRAPFPAKPLTQAPAGWRLDASDSAPPFTREVELSPGSKITLTIRPHLLIPDSDGVNAFDIAEPGYENSLGYQQASTVAAILANSIRQLDEDSKQLSTAVDSLQQLLVSLPKPIAPPEPQPEPVKITKPAPNIRKK